MARLWPVEQGRHYPPGLLDPVLTAESRAVPFHRRMQEDLVRRRTLSALVGELHVELSRADPPDVGTTGVGPEADSRGRVELDHELVGLGLVVHGPESQARR